MANNIGEPQPPLKENFQQDLDIENCISNPQNLVVLPPGCDADIPENNDLYMNSIAVDVVKIQNPDKAYMRIREITAIDLSHHYQGWGILYFGVIIPRVRDGVFQMQNPNKAKRVAIKRLSKAIVNEYLNRGGHENPYTVSS